MFQRDTSPSFFDMFTAVFFGALAAMLVHDGLVELRVRYELYLVDQALAKELKAIQAKEQRDIDARQLRQYEEAERARASASARALAARLERERQERKELAWGNFYTPTAGCKVDSSTMACANEFMAAKKRFVASYVDR